MVSTKFVNKTALDFKLKEGNAGVYRDLAVLKGTTDPSSPHPQGHCTVVLDAHATYRKYTVVAVGHKTKKSRVLVSSDMCQDNSVVNIVLNSETGKFETDCESRVEAGKDSEHSWRSSASSGGGKISRLFDFVKNLGK